ncbi:MAG: NAD(P)-binding domain-containing protein [Candidatus Bathyarchaeota archaeon]
MKQGDVCVIGLGTVGLPTALYIKRKGFGVYGYDISNIKVDGLRVTSNWNEVPETINIYVICVSTGLDVNQQPDLKNIYDVCEKIKQKNPDALVCIESTIPLGTCKSIVEKFNLRKVAHCPHRYWKEDPKHHGVKQLRVLGAVSDEALKLAKNFYTKLGIPTYLVSKVEIAELCKIVENTYRFVQIAFAEELRILCENFGLSFEEVRKACNTKWNIEILEARQGIGGECLPKDTKYSLSIAKCLGLNLDIVEAALKADEKYKAWIRRRGW